MATDLEIAKDRLERVRALLRRDSANNSFLHDSISTSRFKESVAEVKGNLQREIAVVEGILSINPTTVQQTDIP